MTRAQMVKEIHEAIVNATQCGGQHTGWPCGTCFFAAYPHFTNQHWQMILLIRGDHKRQDLNNLPQDEDATLLHIHNTVTKG